jgi:hypothetical protein
MRNPDIRVSRQINSADKSANLPLCARETNFAGRHCCRLLSVHANFTCRCYVETIRKFASENLKMWNLKKVLSLRLISLKPVLQNLLPSGGTDIPGSDQFWCWSFKWLMIIWILTHNSCFQCITHIAEDNWLHIINEKHGVYFQFQCAENQW